MKKKIAVIATALWLSPLAWAHPIEGRWLTPDLETGKPRGEVTIKLVGEVLEVRISGGTPKPGETVKTVCVKCPGALKDQPMLGLRMVWDMREKDGIFEGGRLLDPDTGNVYKGNMKLSPDGKQITVRGYIGLPAFGRSTVWTRLP